MNDRTVIWDEKAVLELKSQLDFIKEGSIVQAQKVKDEILRKTAELAIRPEKYPKEY